MRSISPSGPRVAAFLQVAVVVVSGLVLAGIFSRLELTVAGGLVVAGAFTVFFLLRPDLGLLTVLLVRTFTDVTARLATQPGAIGNTGFGLLANIGLILVLIVSGGIFILSRGVPLLSLPGGRALGLLLLAGLVGFLRSPSPMLAASEWLPVVGAAVVYALAAYFFARPQRMQRVIDVVCVSFLAPAAFGFMQLLQREGIANPDFRIPRIYGTFAHSNSFGFYLVMILAVFLCQALVHRGPRRSAMLLGLAAVSPLLIATFTRVAWVGAILVLLVVGVLRYRGVLLALPVLALLVGMTVPAVGLRLSDPLSGSGSLADRLYRVWPTTLREWREATEEPTLLMTAVNRLAGLGPGAGQILAARGGRRGVLPHNDYLRVLYEYGIFGLILFLVLILVLIMTGLRAWRASENPTASAVALTFTAVVVAFAAMSLTDNVFGYTANQVYYWTLAGLVAGLHSVRRRAEEVSS